MDRVQAVKRFERAIGPGVGTAVDRRGCAETLCIELAQGIIWGEREARLQGLLPKLAKIARSAHDALARWQIETQRSLDAFALHQIVGQKIEGIQEIQINLDCVLDYLAFCANLAKEFARGTPRKKRGKQNVVAVTVVERLATAYSRHLTARPGAGHRGTDDDPSDQSRRHTRFRRVCRVADRLLHDLGYPIALSDSAIELGLQRARRANHRRPSDVG